QALAHRSVPGATVFGCVADARVSPEWAAWANGVAVRELDFHDTFLAAEYSHPADNIPAVLAVAQHMAGRASGGRDGGTTGTRTETGRSTTGHDRAPTGEDVVRAIATGYEVQMGLSRAISLHKHKI